MTRDLWVMSSILWAGELIAGVRGMNAYYYRSIAFRVRSCICSCGRMVR